MRDPPPAPLLPLYPPPPPPTPCAPCPLGGGGARHEAATRAALALAKQREVHACARARARAAPAAGGRGRLRAEGMGAGSLVHEIEGRRGGVPCAQTRDSKAASECRPEWKHAGKSEKRDGAYGCECQPKSTSERKQGLPEARRPRTSESSTWAGWQRLYACRHSFADLILTPLAEVVSGERCSRGHGGGGGGR